MRSRENNKYNYLSDSITFQNVQDSSFRLSTLFGNVLLQRSKEYCSVSPIISQHACTIENSQVLEWKKPAALLSCFEQQSASFRSQGNSYMLRISSLLSHLASLPWVWFGTLLFCSSEIFAQQVLHWGGTSQISQVKLLTIQYAPLARKRRRGSDENRKDSTF